MAVTGQNVVNVANKYLGKGGSFVWNRYGLAKGTAWCVGFICYVMEKAGVKNLFYDGKPVFYVPYADNWLKAHCTHVKMADARPGDIVVFTWDANGYNAGRGSRDHIGFIRKAGTSSTAYTVEGNTSGSIVAQRTRPAKYIRAIYRPKYNGSTGGTTTKPATSTATTYKVGKDYTLRDYMNVRTGAGTGYAIKKVKNLTADGRRHATSSYNNANAVLKKGTVVTCMAVKTVGSDVWIKIPSGWICAKQGRTVYVK